MQGPGVNRYRRQQLESMSPEQLVLVVYERAIVACRRQDRRRLRRALEQLILALDFEQGEIADRLLLLYDWVLRLGREGRFAEAEKVLGQLRAMWEEALQKERGGERAAAPAPGDGGPLDLTG
jgi:flagellin-specific chaperone FliS